LILVKDAMVKEVISADVKTSLDDICRLMGEKHIGSVIITRKGKPEGIFTERDLLSKVVLNGIDLKESYALDYMSAPLTVIRSHYELKEAARAMTQLKIRRLPVVDNGELLGIITSADIVKAIAEEPLKI
jgi:CBS domain-containing protein